MEQADGYTPTRITLRDLVYGWRPLDREPEEVFSDHFFIALEYA